MFQNGVKCILSKSVCSYDTSASQITSHSVMTDKVLKINTYMKLKMVLKNTLGFQ